MKEEHANSGMEGREPDGDAPPSTAAPARAPLGEWRGPAFWMTCGALVVMLVLGAVMLVQRVGVERDMMAVAATATAPAATAPAAAGPTSGTAAKPPNRAGRPAGPAPETASGAPATATATATANGAPAAPTLTARAPRTAARDARNRTGMPDTSNARPHGTASRVAAPSVAAPPPRGGSLAPGTKSLARAPAVQRPTVTAPAVKAAVKAPRYNTAKRKLKRSARGKVPTQEGNYAKVFIRCPLPGEPGSVECRRHICNGAESEGPACKPYRGRLR